MSDLANPPENTFEEKLLAEVTANDLEVPELDLAVTPQLLPTMEMMAVVFDDDES